jgi:hypothetical protein
MLKNTRTFRGVYISATAVALTVATLGSSAQAEAPPQVSSSPADAAPAPKPAPPPYSLPWQLRPVLAVNVVRSDTSIAMYEDAATKKSGSTVASTLLVSYKVLPQLATMLRFAYVTDSPPDSPTAKSGTALVNPLVGATYAGAIGPMRWNGFAGAAIPVGQGGGDKPDPAEAAAASKGIPARSAMDNAMFAVNYFTAIGGGSVAYLAHKATIQAEVTVLQLIRARGPETLPTGVATDASRTNLTAGVHAGYSIIPMISVGGELRYQRWLSDAAPTKTPGGRETVTMAVGPRFHFKVGDQWLRPGISYSLGLDEPVSKSKYQMVQIDVPFLY